MDEAERAKIETRIARVEQQIRAFRELHAGELQTIIDELASIRAELASVAESESAPPVAPGPLADPAANSPRRAAWLAEQKKKEEERTAPLSRRELLRGRDREG